MELIQISNITKKISTTKKTIRHTQSICPDCNMILDAEVFERDGKVYMTKTCPSHGECEELYLDLWICIKNSVRIGKMERVHMLPMLW
jgi:hypothetical protein